MMSRKVLVGIVLACLILGMIPIPVATEEDTYKPMSLHFPDSSELKIYPQIGTMSNEKPIAEATVTAYLNSHTEKYSDETNAGGYYKIENVPFVEGAIEANAKEYTSVLKNSGREQRRIDFELEKIENYLPLSEFKERIKRDPTETNNLIGKKIKIRGEVFFNGRKSIVAAEGIGKSVDVLNIIQGSLESVDVAISSSFLGGVTEELGFGFVKDILQLLGGGSGLLKDEIIEAGRYAVGCMYILGTTSQDQEYYDRTGDKSIVAVYPPIKKERLWANPGSIVEITGTVKYGYPTSSWLIKDFLEINHKKSIFWIDVEYLKVIQPGIPENIDEKIGNEISVAGVFDKDDTGAYVYNLGNIRIYLENFATKYWIKKGSIVRVEGILKDYEVKQIKNVKNYHCLYLKVTNTEILLGKGGEIVETKVKIANFEPPTGEYHKGDAIITTVSILNINDKERTFWVGLTFFDEIDNEYDLPPKSTTLKLGETDEFIFTWEVPSDAIAGRYDAATAIWEGYDPGKDIMTGALYDEEWKYDVFGVVEDQEIPWTDFSVLLKPDKTTYQPGESAKVTIDVTNNRDQDTEIWLGTTFKYPTLKEPKDIPLKRAVIPKGETESFDDIEWTIPADAPLGQYEIAVNCWKDAGQNEYYTDNIVWAPIFNVDMITPVKARENVEDALGALASMAEAYYGFMELIYELSEVEPPEGSEVEFNYHVLSSRFCNNIAEAQTYMSSSGIESADMNDALELVRELELAKTGFCIVIVDYSFIGFGEYESGTYPIVCNEKGDPFWESWQFYEMIKEEIEEGYKEYEG